MADSTSVVARVFGWLGFVAHLATGIWYAAAGLLAPLWAVIVLWIIWLGMTVWAFRLARSGTPLWTLAVPLIDIAIFFAAISAGEAFLGWTA